MRTSERTCRVGEEVIRYDLDFAETDTNSAVVALHGGGNSSKETTKYLAQTITGCGLNLIRLDFSGQGKSSGQMSDSSLEKRVSESRGVIQDSGMRPVAILGTSMGGYIATKLLESFEVRTLILFCPAAYSEAAFRLKFGSGFTQEIRRENSFRETDVPESCRRFRGRVLFVIGEADDIIPGEVIRIYEDAFPNCRSFEKLVIEDCPHPIHKWAESRPVWQERIRSKVGQLLYPFMPPGQDRP